MAIKQVIEITIAEVEVNDEFRVDLRQDKRRTDYSPHEAEALADELRAAAGSARRMLAEYLGRETVRRVEANDGKV